MGVPTLTEDFSVSITGDATLKKLEVSKSVGLSAEQVAERQQHFGILLVTVQFLMVDFKL